MKLAASLVALAALALPSAALASTPQLGVEQTLRRGFFTETDLGTYFDFRTAAPATTSNAQAYLQLGIGYDFTDCFSVSLQFGLGASSGVCLADVATAGEDSGTCGVVTSAGTLAVDSNGNKQVLPDNFSNTFYQLNLSYRIPLIDRLAFVPAVVAGYQKLDPAPLLTSAAAAASTTDTSDPNNLLSGGAMFGVDLSLEYATHLDHFFVGLDVEPRFLVGPNLLSLAIYPRVKYTF